MVEKFHRPGTQTYKNHYIDLQLTALKLYNDICGAVQHMVEHECHQLNLSYENVVLNQSKVIEETTLMREQIKYDVLNSKEQIEQKYNATGKYKGACGRPKACVSHEEKDSVAARKETEIRSNGNNVDKKLPAYPFKTKKTKAKRRLSALQKIRNQKGNMIRDDAITTVAKMYDIDQMDRLNTEKELHDPKKISWIFDNIRCRPTRFEAPIIKQTKNRQWFSFLLP